LPHASSSSLDIIGIELDSRLYESGLTAIRFKKPGKGVLEVTIKRSGLSADESRMIARRSTERYLSDDRLQYKVKDDAEGLQFDVADRVMLHHRFTIRIHS
jgi:hypothetical protein